MEPGDEKLRREEFNQKYKGDILETKSIEFLALDIESQKDILLSSLIGKDVGKAKEIKDAKIERVTFVSVRSYLQVLHSIGKLEEWVQRTIPTKNYPYLPLEEKIKYHNALVSFHDQCMTKLKGQPSSQGRVLDSSPTVRHKQMGGGCPPDFNDPNKWKIE
jgi:hypothetical protein